MWINSSNYYYKFYKGEAEMELLNKCNSKYGEWSKDEVELPCFDLELDKNPVPYYHFGHIMSTGHISILTNQWGNVNLLTTEGGTTALTPTTGKTRSGLYLMLQLEKELISLLYSELNLNRHIRYGIGYAEYYGEVKAENLHLAVTQKFIVPPDKRRGFFCYFTVKNMSDSVLKGNFYVRSDIYPRPVMSYESLVSKLKAEYGNGFACFTKLTEEQGDIFLVGEQTWKGNIKLNSLCLENNIELKQEESVTMGFYLGYGRTNDYDNIREYLLAMSPIKIKSMWKEKLSVLSLETKEEWIRDECIWTLGQLLSFENYDSSVDEYFVTLGGYGYFSNPDEPCFSGFGVREACETAIVLSIWYPKLAKSSLRWAAKTQLYSGDIPKGHSHRREKDIKNMEIESDTEIWFILGCCEYVLATEDYSFLEEKVAFCDKEEATPIWEHIKKALQWIKTGVGFGIHGLVLMKDGDWNDYLSKMGSEGKGESVMNSGMACRAFTLLSKCAKNIKENEFSVDIEIILKPLKIAVGACFDKEWFSRGFSDDGKAIGGFEEDRTFLNAQSWAVLGLCGTNEQRKVALLSAVRKCHTDIGMTLMSKPYSSPAPDYISWCPIPAGEGENAGIWPQTVYWMIWALAEEGLVEEATQEWKCMSLRNHSKVFPETPFGIYNGPDCYSSKYSGRAEGWTQVQVFSRMVGTPMNPIIAWQAFAMKKISEAIIRQGD